MFESQSLWKPDVKQPDMHFFDYYSAFSLRNNTFDQSLKLQTKATVPFLAPAVILPNDLSLKLFTLCTKPRGLDSAELS